MNYNSLQKVDFYLRNRFTKRTQGEQKGIVQTPKTPSEVFAGVFEETRLKLMPRAPCGGFNHFFSVQWPSSKDDCGDVSLTEKRAYMREKWWRLSDEERAAWRAKAAGPRATLVPVWNGRSQAEFDRNWANADTFFPLLLDALSAYFGCSFVLVAGGPLAKGEIGVRRFVIPF